ncbi:MAG: hypothetical protein ACLP6E_16445 [Acidimicrobiales bacterium]
MGTYGAAYDYHHDLRGFESVHRRLPDCDAIGDVASAMPGLDLLANNADRILPGRRIEAPT